MLHTISAAGKATFFTSLTTAAAFGANIASSVSYRNRLSYASVLSFYSGHFWRVKSSFFIVQCR